MMRSRVTPHPPRRASTGTVLHNNQPRRNSLQALLGRPLGPQGPPANRKQQIAAALKKVVHAVQTEGIENREGIPDHLRDLLNGLVRSGELRKEDRLEVMLENAKRMSDLENESTMAKGIAAVETLAVSYADLTTDVLMISKYYGEGRFTEASLMLGVLGFSLFMQGTLTQ